VATPETKVWELQPEILVPPDLKLIVPVAGFPPPYTVAVKVVGLPVEVGDGVALRTVVLVPLFTVSDVVPVDVV
jgi:hypothetical protein